MPPIRAHALLTLATLLTPAVILPAQAGTFILLHTFQAGTDAANPAAPLAWINNKLASTSLSGGTGGFGTAYAITLATHAEQTLHNFTDLADGGDPFSNLTALNGKLYGTTSSGGAHSAGTIFALAPDGTQTVVYSFTGPQDGRFPLSGLVAMNGVLYGVTAAGGDPSCNGGSGCGVVYAFVPTTNTFTTVDRLSDATGWFASANLLPVNGTLYGTAPSGGAHGNGTVFSVTPQGDLKVLYSFTGGADGGFPVASLTQSGGVLLGTTQSGGAHNLGVAFALTPSGAETVLHAFGSGKDGAEPASTLTPLNGKFYGTTSSGGAYSGGTIFSITPSGQEVVEHSLAGLDGIFPNTGLTLHNGTFYGTAYTGGSAACGGFGCGTVFSYTPYPAVPSATQQRRPPPTACPAAVAPSARHPVPARLNPAPIPQKSHGHAHFGVLTATSLRSAICKGRSPMSVFNRPSQRRRPASLRPAAAPSFAPIALAAALLLPLTACVQPVAGPPGPAMASQCDTLQLENTDRIGRFQRLASLSGTHPPLVDQLDAPEGSVPGCPFPAPVVRVLFDEAAFFDSGSDQPKPSAAPYLDLIAENMKRDVPDASLTLLGHTDAVGSDALNIGLSKRRAARVMAALIERGVPFSQLGTVAIGKAQPIAPNLTAAGRAHNRRVEFMISGSEAANLAVVTHRTVIARYLRLATAAPVQAPSLDVALLKPDRAPANNLDFSFLHQTATLALAKPSLAEPPSDNAEPGHAPKLAEPPADSR